MSGHGQLPPPSAAAPSADSAPVLDIGGEVGALVVHLAAPPPSGELEACPVGEPAARFHTGAHRRAMGFGASATAWTAVFPEVVEGSYHLLDPGGSPLATVSMAGGTVRELDLR